MLFLLNQFCLTSFDIKHENLEIYFKIIDEVIISDYTSKIVSFIENNLNCQIIFDSYFIAKLEENKIKKIEFKDTIRKLEELKKSDIQSNDDFKKYCAFCESTLCCLLRPYQYLASYFLIIGHGGFDFSVPGSGKTIISYAAYNKLKSIGECDSILIIGPINSFNAWHDEYYTCFNSEPDFISLANYNKSDSSSYFLSSYKYHKEITFVNVDKAWRLKNEIITFLNGKKALLIVDEAHKEKNPDASITKAVLEITKFAVDRIILTGTPMPNGYEDLFSLLKIYSPYEKIIPFSYSDLKRFSKTGADESQQKVIMDSIFPLYSRVSKKHLLDTGELNNPIFNRIECTMSEEQQKIYDFLNKISYEIDDDLESILNLNLMKAILIRKMQVSANPGLLSKSIIYSIDEYKKEYIDDFECNNLDMKSLIIADNIIKERIANSKIVNLINKFDSGYMTTNKNKLAADLAFEITSRNEKVIIRDVFVQNMNVLKKIIENKCNFKIEIINGTINGVERQRAIDNFKNGDSRILIANPATLAESISLHRTCQNAIYVNRNFNAAQFIQSKDRIHRINMPKGKTANYYFLLNKDTVDIVVDNKLSLKENRMLKILDSKNITIGGSEFENNSFMCDDDVVSAFRK